jgi:hypothetical protein
VTGCGYLGVPVHLRILRDVDGLLNPGREGDPSTAVFVPPARNCALPVSKIVSHEQAAATA